MVYHRVFHRLSLVVFSIARCVGWVNPVLNTVHAQDGTTSRQLVVGDTVTATLNSDTFVQVFTFNASAGDSITVDVSTETEELSLVLVVTDQRGNVVAQDDDITTPTTASLADITIPSAGTYYILVMRGTGADNDASGSFTLRLGGIQQIGGQTVTLDTAGLTFELSWTDAVNLNLEVRDPVGGTVHAFSPGAPSGGTLDTDVNADCDTAISGSPAETIAWPPGEVPAGSYEIIIYYLDGCSVGGPEVFNLSANVNGSESQTITGTLNPSQRYLSRLVLESDGTWTLDNGGVNAGLDVTLFQNEIANAEPVAVGSTVSGTITNAVPAQAYTFEAVAGTTVNIALEALNGSLDTYLALLGPDKTVLVVNDDFDNTSTNSAIERSLSVDGTYTVIATRYGLTIGGTEGDYTMSITTAAQAATTTDTGTTDTGTPAEGTPAAETALPDGTVKITLTWLSNADLQLLVRDPNGDTIYDDFPQSRSGGILAEDGNVGCVDTTTNPVSYIYWPPNRLLPGTYEIEVWYQNSCDDTTPVNFALTVEVQGQTIINTTQPTSPDARYMITFTVAQDGTATAGSGDFFDMANANSLNYQSLLTTASPITYGQTVSGSITDQQRFVLYTFEGQQGDIVSIGMDATGGTLDPALYLISSEGIQLEYNDDIEPGEISDALIEQYTLATTGTYYIIATHYGLNVGGTQGTYNLSLIQE
jgi:hypothetical protein